MSQHELSMNGVRWVHVNNPTTKDIEYINSVFPFHSLVIDSIVAPTYHPLIEDFEDHLFLILHFPIIYPGRRANKIAEIDFLISKDTLITITYVNIPRLDEIFRSIKESEELQKKFQKNTAFMLYYIIDRLFQAHLKDVDFLEREVTRIEDEIFKEHAHITVADISHVRRDVLDFRRPLKAQTNVLAAFRDKAEKFYGKEVTPYFVDLLVSEERIVSLVENQRETLDVLHETHASLMSDRTSHTIRVLTVFSAIILPLSLISSIWGMNHTIMPLRDSSNDFWIIIGLMGAVAVVLLLFFKKRNWI